MKTTVYLDVLFCVNFIIDYIILLSVKRLTALPARRLRLLSGAAVGGIGSFVILMPPLPFGVSLLISIAEAFLITAAAFAPMVWAKALKAALLMFAVSFIYCGFMTAVFMFFSPRALAVRNSAVYVGISPLTLVVLTIVFYGIMRLFLFLFVRERGEERLCRVRISCCGRTVEGEGFFDTGNTLHEPFSGDSVIVGKSSLFPEFAEVSGDSGFNSKLCSEKSFRLIPFVSVGGNGLLPAFRPSEIMIVSKKKKTKVRAYLALGSEKNFSDGCSFIVPAELGEI